MGQDRGVVVVSGEDGPGDDGSVVDHGSEGLGVEEGSVGDVGDGDGSGVDGLGDHGDVLRVRVANNVGGVDRAQSVVDDVAGQTTGSGGGNSQNGEDNSLFNQKIISDWSLMDAFFVR